MKALSMDEPYPILCLTRQPCDRCPNYSSDPLLASRHHGHDLLPMVKRFETRSWPCPPNLIGSRIALHATQRAPEIGHVGDWRVIDVDGDSWAMYRYGALGERVMLPLGAVVGSAVIEACYPITDNSQPIDRIVAAPDRPALTLYRMTSGPSEPRTSTFEDVSDQLPYGDYRPGRYAWLLADAAPTTERCPWCEGSGDGERIDVGGRGVQVDRCPVCDGTGRCEPIPARGRQRIWNWQP